MSNTGTGLGTTRDPDRRTRPLPDDDLDEIAAQVEDQMTGFLVALRAVADEGQPDIGVAHLLLAVSQLLFAGGRLGALADIVPAEAFETDAGDDPDLDTLRERLADVLGSSDDYVEVFDPYDVAPPVPMRISDDLAHVALQVAHGLQHAEAGRYREALWWWQFSYLSTWGSTAAAALRALVSLVSHDRFDARTPTEAQLEDQLVAEVVGAVVGIPH